MSIRIPAMRKHSASNRAYVYIGGRDIYLGKWNSAEASREYRRIIAEWMASDCSPSYGANHAEMTIKSLIACHLKHLRKTKGTGANSDYHRVKPAYATLKELYGGLKVVNFGQLQFKAVRMALITDDRTRRYVNSLMKRIRRLFKWAVSQDMAPAEIVTKLSTIDPLRPGESEAKEKSKVLPISREIVDKTIPHMPPTLQAMVRLQIHCGCRPGEICALTPGMIDRSGNTWIATIHEHKTAYRGIERKLYFGPSAQKVLAPYLFRDPNARCFTPAQAQQERNSTRTAERVTPPNCGNRAGYTRRIREGRDAKKGPGDEYNTQSYGKAIRYACARAFPVPKGSSKEAKEANRDKYFWSPNRLRHLAATEIRKELGIEFAQVVLGHQQLEVTQVYAERDEEAAMKAIQGRAC